MTNEENNQILIIGAGPSGLAMAHELTRRGIKCRIIEKLSVPSDKSKALGIQPRSIELFETMGILDDFLREALKVKVFNIYSNLSTRISHVETKYIHSTYPYFLMLPQNKTEEIFTKKLAKLGVKIERELELTSYAQEENHIVARIKNPKGQIEEIKVQYLIGCDGAHSICRKLMGSNFIGDQYDTNWLLLDAYIKWPLKFNEMYVFFSKEGFLAAFPMGENFVRFVIDYDASLTHEELEKKLNLDFFQQLINNRVVDNIQLTEIVWKSAFSIHHRMAEKLCSKNVFLIDDSAHIHSPAGGQGMNTGTQDANALAWKMALVIQKRAKPELLQTYQERHKVMENIVELTHLTMLMASIKNPILQFIRNKILFILGKSDKFKNYFVNRIAQLKLNYRHSSIVAEDWQGKQGDIRPGDLFPDIEVFDKTHNKTRLKKIIKDLKHNLLIFTRDNNAQEIENSIKLKYNDVIDVIIIKD
jgi:2-polyprenyl-6-methoxyphenol hydroxylase-like FAD-dependent oxidoreductase